MCVCCKSEAPRDLVPPTGSSGGEGALIGSGASLLGVGGDIGGSIRIPCHCCGISGFKPTTGRIRSCHVGRVRFGELVHSGKDKSVKGQGRQRTRKTLSTQEWFQFVLS